nr:AbrB family transcriptional regulator [Mesorhizobium sp.]
MDSLPNPPAPNPPALEHLARVPKVWQWLALLIFSMLFAGALEFGALPAALLIGPMLAAILAGANGATVRVPQPLFGAAQAIVGCLVAASISADIFPLFYKEWPLFLGVVVATVAASSLLGWLISRWRILPGTTAVWGSSPGAATAMVLMAGAFGADQRLVAFMQYLRVILVSMTAALVARVDTSGIEIPAIIWFPPIDPIAFAATIGVALVGSLIGKLFRLPSPFFLGTFIFGTAVHLGLGVTMQLPPWLLALFYTMIGWTIGLNFTRAILRHATRALPQIVGSIIILHRLLRRPRLHDQPCARHRSADRLSGDQPRRHGQASPSSPPPHSMSPSSWRCDRPASSSCCWSDRAWRGWWREV